MSSSGAVQTYDISPWDEMLLTSGEETVPRGPVNSGAVGLTTSGRVYLTYFTARKTETINNVLTVSGFVAAAATPSLCRVGFYSVAANGDIALLAACANDTAMWSATTTNYTAALTAPWGKVAGQRYAFAALCVTGAATPQLLGVLNGGGAANLGSFAPRIFGQVTGQVDLPANVAAASIVTFDGRLHYAAALP